MGLGGKRYVSYFVLFAFGSACVSKENLYFQFRCNFCILRRTAYKLIDEFPASPWYPAADHGGSQAKSEEQHLLSFLWWVLDCGSPCSFPLILVFITCTQLRYAVNKACIRDVAGRFNLGESTLYGMMDRVLDFILSIRPHLIKFPVDLERLSRDFEEVSTMIQLI